MNDCWWLQEVSITSPWLRPEEAFPSTQRREARYVHCILASPGLIGNQPRNLHYVISLLYDQQMSAPAMLFKKSVQIPFPSILN